MNLNNRRSLLMQTAAVLIFLGLSVGRSYAGEAAAVKFAALPEAVSFISVCLDADDYVKLYSACLRTKGSVRAFSVLQYFHRKSPLTARYSGREFPSKGASFELGGHNSELGHVHIDFVKRDGFWYIDSIWICR